MSLSRISRTARGINSRQHSPKYSIDYVNFCCVEDNMTAYSGKLQVDSVHYVFDYHPTTEQVHISCSLDDFTIFKKSSNKQSAQLYFGHFISNTTFPVKHIDIENCKRAFSGLKNLRIPSLRWNFDGTFWPESFSAFAKDHIFERIELNNPNDLTVCETSNIAKHVIVNYDDYKKFTAYAKEQQYMKHSHWKMFNGVIGQVTFQLQFLDSFLLLCRQMLRNRLFAGSSFTGIFKKSMVSKGYLWRILRETFPNSREVSRGHEKCLRLEETDEFETLVMQGVHRVAEGEISFMVYKVPRIRLNFNKF